MYFFSRYKKGTALVYSLIIVTIVIVILSGIVSFVISHIRLSLHEQPRQESLHLAEAGIYFYRWYLSHEVDGKTATEVEDFWSGEPLGVDDNGDGDCDDAETGSDIDGDGTEAYTVDYNGRGNVGKYSICVIAPEAGSTNVLIQSTGWSDKKPTLQRTVQVQVRRPPWSEFALLANTDLDVPVGTDVIGAVHSNGGILFDGTAHNLVSSGVTSYTHPVHGTQDGVWTQEAPASVFLAGTSFPDTAQDFNSVVVAFAQIQEAAAGQFDFDPVPGGQGYHLTFHNDGTADVCWVKKVNKTTKAITKENCSGAKTARLTLADTNAIYASNDIWIDGMVDAGKRVSVAAYHNGNGNNPNIYINGDLVYENYTSGTTLGLVAENDIEVIRSPNIAGEGPNDSILEIDAALLAQSGRVGRSAYGSTLPGVKIYGAIATYGSYGFADTTTVNIEYDTNFRIIAPPFFPTGSAYVIDAWEEI